MYPDDFSYIGGMTELEKMGPSVPQMSAQPVMTASPSASFLRPKLTTYHQDA